MKCARCSAALDEGVMVCSQCGAVVGMTYGRGPNAVKPPPAAKPAPSKPAAPIAAGAAPRTGTTKGLTERAKAILLSPRAEWGAIAAEPVRAYDVWLGYVVPLALIGPAALAIAQVAFGTSFPLVGVVKAALVAGIAAALLTFAFSLVQVAVLAWAVHAMAKKFEAVPDHLAALQVVAYSLTPVWLAGVLYLVPPLAFLWLFAAAYALLLCLFGLRTLMRCTPQQALGYALTTLGIAFALWVITGTIVTALMGFGPVMFE
jgi:Yip1 domain